MPAKKKKPAPRPAAPPDPPPPPGDDSCPYITEQLRTLAVPVDSVSLDPANARKHPAKNLQATLGSLRAYGQRKPIVVNRATNTIEAGNGTWLATRELGRRWIAAVFVEDDPTTAAGYSLADNRAAELAQWDKEALDAILRTVQTEDQDLADMLTGLAEDEGVIPAGGDDDEAADLDPGEGRYREQYGVVVLCPDEGSQQATYEALAARYGAEGYEVKVVTT